MPTYRDDAIVLRTYNLGEADRIVIVLANNTGKVRTVARGIRKTLSKFGGRLEPGNHVDAQFATGRGALDVLTQTEVRHAFDFRADYPMFTASQVLLEAADKLVVEDKVPAPAMFRLLLGALVALDRGIIEARQIVDSYLLRALATSGWLMAISACAICGAEQDHGWFAPAHGGIVCDRCRLAAASPVDTQLLTYLGVLLSGDWDHRHVDASVQRKATGIISAFTQWTLEGKLQSLPFLTL